jgi:hypothetical protein
MLAKSIAHALIAFTLAGTAAGATDIARLPGAVGPLATYDFALQSGWPLASPGLIDHPERSGAAPLSENSWDFTNPESIPGFGTLPPGYGSGPLLPRFSTD